MISHDDTSAPDDGLPDDPSDHGGSGEITVRMEQLIVALLSEPSVSKACSKADVPQRTFHRWMSERPEFVTAYRKARRDSFQHAIVLTQKYAGAAVNTLARIMTDASAPHSARTQAATAILRFGKDGIELEDLAARIESLEEQAKAAKEEETPRGWRR